MLKPNKSKPEMWRMFQLFFLIGRKWAVLETPYLEQAVLLLIFTSPPQPPARNLYIVFWVMKAIYYIVKMVSKQESFSSANKEF